MVRGVAGGAGQRADARPVRDPPGRGVRRRRAGVAGRRHAVGEPGGQLRQHPHGHDDPTGGAGQRVGRVPGARPAPPRRPPAAPAEPGLPPGAGAGAQAGRPLHGPRPLRPGHAGGGVAAALGDDALQAGPDARASAGGTVGAVPPEGGRERPRRPAGAGRVAADAGEPRAPPGNRPGLAGRVVGLPRLPQVRGDGRLRAAVGQRAADVRGGEAVPLRQGGPPLLLRPGGRPAAPRSGHRRRRADGAGPARDEGRGRRPPTATPASPARGATSGTGCPGGSRRSRSGTT